jgi:peptide alpha-N-acetyltransferase
MKKKKSCNDPTAQNDSVIIKNGFTENIDVLSTITTTSSDQIMASDSLKNRDRTSLIGDSGPVNGEIIENLTPELLLHEKLGTKPKQTNDSSRIESSQNSSSIEESNQINSATEQVNCQLQDLRLNPNFDETPKSCQNDGGSEKTQQSSMTVDSVENRTQDLLIDSVSYAVYENELQMPDIMKLIQKDLSEPYSIYTYRYFIHNWPHLCYMARVNGECVGAIVCKLDFHKKVVKRGYIAMLAVDSCHRKRKIGSTLVKRAIDAMIAEDADEVVLETEITNKPALRLYENLGFVRDKRLFRYYLNGVDALGLKLWLR